MGSIGSRKRRWLNEAGLRPSMLVVSPTCMARGGTSFRDLFLDWRPVVLVSTVLALNPESSSLDGGKSTQASSVKSLSFSGFDVLLGIAMICPSRVLFSFTSPRESLPFNIGQLFGRASASLKPTKTKASTVIHQQETNIVTL